MLACTLSAQNDRATFGLKGNVKKVIQNEDLNHRAYSHNPMESLDLEFNKEGKLVSVGDSVIKKEWREDGLGNKSYEEEFVSVANEYGEYETTYFLTRDGNGRISTVTYWGHCDVDPTDIFMYDSTGRLVVIKSTGNYIGDDPGDDPDFSRDIYFGITRYYYDVNGNVSKYVFYDADDKKTTVTTYTYQTFDSVGNWLVRVADREAYGIKNKVEKRTVTYW